jgi:hypothetical protein
MLFRDRILSTCHSFISVCISCYFFKMRIAEETIEALRNWLREGRAQSASFQEIREAEQQFVPLQLEIGR